MSRRPTADDLVDLGLWVIVIGSTWFFIWGWGRPIKE
jgi:hypothetical protein